MQWFLCVGGFHLGGLGGLGAYLVAVWGGEVGSGVACVYGAPAALGGVLCAG